MRKLPLLIIAQSARFLAQAASLAGFRVWGADCFADSDACDVAERWQLLAPLNQQTAAQLLEVIIALSQDEPCQLIYGGGIEHFPSLFDQLPDHIQLRGNTSHTLKMINQPASFFALLAESQLPFPDISWQRPNQQTAWLFKPNVSLGGQNILPAHKATAVKEGYFQRQITGVSLSALFIANSIDTQLIGINRQWAASTPETPFRLGGIERPYLLDKSLITEITHAINTITFSTGLIGLNSLDFMISNEGKLYLLEINPRPTASIELYHAEYPILKAHLNACQTHSFSQAPTLEHAPFRLLSYLYAAVGSIIIPHQFDWPSSCQDIPTEGTHIGHRQPICSLLISGASRTHCYKRRSQLEIEISSQLTTVR